VQSLVDAGMVGRRKEGLTVICFIADPSITDLCDNVCSNLLKRLSQPGEETRRRMSRFTLNQTSHAAANHDLDSRHRDRRRHRPLVSGMKEAGIASLFKRRAGLRVRQSKRRSSQCVAPRAPETQVLDVRSKGEFERRRPAKGREHLHRR
jgi:hypothetical protein